MSDSLISGQPLYLLNLNPNPCPPAAGIALARATQATGSVRLHVTGSPPTTSSFDNVSLAQDARPAGRAAAIIAWSIRRRWSWCALNMRRQVVIALAPSVAQRPAGAPLHELLIRHFH